ncbi:MAG: hypothetical protein ACTHZ1_08840 [Sphingobacterium sp.]
MKIKHYGYCILSLTLLLGACHSSGNRDQSSQQDVVRPNLDHPEEIQQISEIITRFARAYLSQDTQKTNRLIHPEHGIAIIYRPGAMDTFAVVDSINYTQPVPEPYDYTVFENNTTLTFEALPEFDCGTMRWEKLGFYCDTTASSVTQHLARIAEFQEEYNEGSFTQEIRAQIDNLETGSYRVILNPDEDDFLIFHVKKFDTGWYVTLLDRAYASCEA